MARIDRTGHVYGRFTVIQELPKDPWGLTRWQCQCICGTVKAVSTQNLTSGSIQSCGCMRRDKYNGSDDTYCVKHPYDLRIAGGRCAKCMIEQSKRWDNVDA